MSLNRSATDLIQLWADGEQSAAESLYVRYAERLCAIAESQLSDKFRQRVGAEDIVQSVFRTFFTRAKAGQFSVDHSGALWKLLVQITLNKVRRQVEYHQAGVRDVNLEVPLNPIDSDSVLASEPNIEHAAALSDELDSLVKQLCEPEPRILQLRLQGLSTDEIAGLLGTTRWTVRRTLNRIGLLLHARLNPET